MKMAVFSDTFDQTNGVAVTIQHLVKYAEEKNIQLDVFTQGDQESIDSFGSAKVFRFKPALPIRFYSDLYFDLILPHKKMLERVKSEKYDIILSVAIGSFGINAMIIAKRLGIPIAAEYNTDVPKYILPRIKKIFGFLPDFMHRFISLPIEAILRKYIKVYYEKCDLVLTVSNYNKRQLEGLIQRKVKIFSRGVDTENFSPLKRKLDLKRKYKATLALYVGRISVDKNIQILIDIFKNREDLRLVLVGDGPFKDEMQKKLPSAIFTGPIYDREKLAEIYASCDFFVFPSETETFGQVITEAMSSGLAVIASGKGASHEQIKHNEDGFVYENEKDLKGYIDYLAGNAQAQRKLGRRARVSALNRTWDSVFDRLMLDCQNTLKSQDIKALPISEFPLDTKKVAKSVVLFILSFLWVFLLFSRKPETVEYDGDARKCHRHSCERGMEVTDEMRKESAIMKNTSGDRY